MLSKPTTATSFGTLIFASLSARIAPIAIKSLAANKALNLILLAISERRDTSIIQWV